MFQKSKPYRNAKLLAHARGQECTMQIPGVCNGDPATVVAAHSNRSSDGKGKMVKAHDYCIAYACSNCHDVYDRRRDSPHEYSEIEWYFDRGMRKTWGIILADGVLK